MNWLQIVVAILYAAGLFGCAMLVRGLVAGDFDTQQAIQGGLALSPAALLIGFFLASFAAPTPDSLIAVALYAPYFAFAAWSLYFALLLRRGRERPDAAVRALVWTLPSVLLTPLGIGLLSFLLPPR